MKFQHGKKAVATAGTPVALGDGLVKSLVIKARESNTGKVYLGDSSVDNADAGQGLSPGETLSLAWPGHDLGNLADIHLDADTNGDGVVFWLIGR